MMKHRTDSVRRMPPAKRLLAAALSLLMAFSVLPLLAGVLILPVSASVTTATDLPTFTFYVPETIYLNPSDNKTFQYYVDRGHSVNGSLYAISDSSNGYYDFICDGATDISITCDASNPVLSTTSASSSPLSGSINGGALSGAINMNSVALVTWTVTFTYNGSQYSANAYSVAYAPNRNVTANGITGYSNNSSKAFASSLIYIQGAQITNTASWVQQDGSSDHRNNYQNVTGSRVLDPLVNGITQPNDDNPHDYGNTSGGAFTGATASFGSCYCVRKDNYGNNSQWTGHIDCNRTPAEIIVDTSRYSNTNKIPNLKLGFLVTDWASATGRRHWYVSDATSVISNPNNPSNASLVTGDIDILKHSRWRDDSRMRAVYGTSTNTYGTVLRDSSGSSTPTLDGDAPGANLDNYNDDVGKKYLEPISISVSGSGTSTVHYYRGCASGNQSNSYVMSCVMVLLQVTTVDKSSLRNLVNECVGTYMNGYYTDTSSWNAYNSALQTACTALGNPAADASAISTAETNLNSAKAALVRGTGTATVTHKSSTGATIATETETYSRRDHRHRDEELFLRRHRARRRKHL